MKSWYFIVTLAKLKTKYYVPASIVIHDCVVYLSVSNLVVTMSSIPIGVLRVKELASR